MDKYKVLQDKNGEKYITTILRGYELLNTPFLNKDTAFSYEERVNLSLLGKLPSKIESLDEQTERCWQQYQKLTNNLNKFVYLNNLHDKNEVLFYNVVLKHVTEMIPIIYTPVISEVVKEFSNDFRKPKGLYLTYSDMNKLDQILDSLSSDKIKAMVVTDGEGVLGIGDQGVGGIKISIGKSMLYSLCGVNPSKIMPVVLDVGTNNEDLLDSKFYLGEKQNRVKTEQYLLFVERFLEAVKRKFGNILIHWEDLGRDNAIKLLDNYKTKYCSFNDDMQGTGAVAAGALLAAINASNISFAAQKIIIFGAGTAGIGIAEQMSIILQDNGLSKEQADSCFFLLDRNGLIFQDSKTANEGQLRFAREVTEKTLYNQDKVYLEEVVKIVKPTVLLGCSTVQGAFNETIVTEMFKHNNKPIIFPLSNPTEKAEAKPADLIKWTDGQVLIATGSPFEPVNYRDKIYNIAQCNNALAFPGIGLGAILVGSKVITNNMLTAASYALAALSPLKQDLTASLLASVEDMPLVAKKVAVSVIEAARKDKVDTLCKDINAQELVESKMWKPNYLPVKV